MKPLMAVVSALDTRLGVVKASAGTGGKRVSVDVEKVSPIRDDKRFGYLKFSRWHHLFNPKNSYLRESS